MVVDQDDEKSSGAESIESFAVRHGICRATVYNEIAAGKLVARKVRTKTVITSEDGRAWRNNLPKLQPKLEPQSA
jgi:hypothetical protein